jgi:benzylsuccinate CoA-transferase BbsF subunit
MGQSGPLKSYAGYGTHGAAIAGLHAVTGWPDREPCGPHGPYSDVIAPRYAVAALGAALLERRRTGKGQYFDISQIECAIHFVEPMLLDQGASPDGPDAMGLFSYSACPNGVYRTKGTERYVAIAVETEEQWHGLLRVAPLGRFAADTYCTIESRRPVSDRIDAALSAWASQFEHTELERLLIEAGVPASSVLRMSDALEDPQMVSRGHFVTLEHAEIGPMPYDGLATHFSAKRTMLHKAAPCVGEDTEYVMRELLGMSADEIASLAELGVFT